MRTRVIAAAAVLASLAVPAAAQQPPPDAEETTALAKKSQNPVGDLISVPFQFNFNTGGDLGDQNLFVLNFQPVIPFDITPDWKMIARTIVPIASVPGQNGVSYSGVGDIQQQVFLTPAHPGKIIWGVGPTFSLPTATATPLRTGTWGGGFDAVVLSNVGPWVLGVLVTQVWPMSDTGGEPKTDQFLLQPFVNFNFGKGWAISTSPIITANWDAADGNQWTVPLGLGITRTTMFSGRPMQLGAQYYHNVTRPQGAAGNLLRITVSLLFPGGK